MTIPRLTEEQSARNAPQTCSQYVSGKVQPGMAVLIEDRWERIVRISSDGKEYLFEAESGQGYWFTQRARMQAGW